MHEGHCLRTGLWVVASIRETFREDKRLFAHV